MVRLEHPFLPEKEGIWITWERQRRTDTLARELRLKLHRFTPPDQYLWKVLVLSLMTVATLIRIRPKRLVIQNPSMALAGLVVFLKPLLRYGLVVDRHSNFKFHTKDDPSLKYRIFHALSRWTVRHADLTIVTNDYLAEIISSWGGRAHVLQDRLPDMDLAEDTDLEGKHTIVMVSSFSADEPIAEVLRAAPMLDDGTVLYMTGNWRRFASDLERTIPANVRLTGYLSERNFQSLVKSADVVLALTTQDHTLLCSAYEAVVLHKPLVTSDTSALRSYFRKGVLFTGHSADELSRTLNRAVVEREERSKEIEELALILEAEWRPRFEELVRRIEKLPSTG